MQIKSWNSSAQNPPGLLISLRVNSQWLSRNWMIWPRYLACIIIYSSLTDSASGLLASLLFPRPSNTLPLRTFHLLLWFSGIFLLPSIPMACSHSSLWSLLTLQSPGETWLALAAFKLQLSKFSWGTVCLLYCTDHHRNTKYFSFLLCPYP